MDPHYYNADEFAMNFAKRNVSSAKIMSRDVPETVHLAPGAGAPAGAAMMVQSSVRGTF
jgi:hypothetical protein